MEFFIVANSFAAPFFSDKSTGFQTAASPGEALDAFAASYSHPAGLYAAECYDDANAYHKGAEPSARWLSNHAAWMQEHKPVVYFGTAPGVFEADHQHYELAEPKAGRVHLLPAERRSGR